jgi:small subunit ribosomal protein S6
MQRKYETLLLFSPELTTEGRQEIVENLSGVISNHSGQVLTIDDWGMRELAYPVQKQTRGSYMRMEFGLDASYVNEFERKIRIADGILKYVIVKLEDSFEAEEA